MENREFFQKKMTYGEVFLKVGEKMENRNKWKGKGKKKREKGKKKRERGKKKREKENEKSEKGTKWEDIVKEGKK